MIPLKDENPTRHRPVVTLLLIATCLGAYFLWQPSPASDTAADVEFTYEHAAVPCEIIEGHPVTPRDLAIGCGADERGAGDEPFFPGKSVALSVLTSMFLHGSLLHLGGNLLFLWIFGNNIEDHLGPFRYLLFYLVAGVAATFAHVALNLDSTVPMIGASGAIAGVMGAYAVWFPEAPVRTLIAFFLITIVRIRAKWVLGFWFVLQFFTSPNSGVAWAAHVGGFLFGLLVGILVRESPRARGAMFTRDRTGAWDPTGGAGYGYYKS